MFSIDKELLSEISRATKLKEPMDRFKGRSTVSFDGLFYFCECNIHIISFANIIILLFLH